MLIFLRTDIAIEDYLGRLQIPAMFRYGKNQSQRSTDDGNNFIPLPKPTDEEFHRLVMEELIQRYWIGGMTVSEAVVLNHNPHMRAWSTDIAVDESTWLPLLQKERWYNLNRRVAEGFPGRLDSRLNAESTWSVDDPVIWDVLKPYVALASRLLDTSLDLPFWDAMLSVSRGLTEWNPTAQRTNLEEPLHLAQNRRFGQRQTRDELRALLAEYAPYIIISFEPLPDDLLWRGRGMCALEPARSTVPLANFCRLSNHPHLQPDAQIHSG